MCVCDETKKKGTLMSLDKRKLNEVFDEAETAFWGSVAEALPEIKTGDFSPSDSAKLEKAMKEAIQSWYKGNQPVGKSASQIIRNLEMRIARLEKSAKPSIETSLFSVGGGNAETGEAILEVNEYDEDVRDALEVAFNRGEFKGFHMEDIKLVSKR